METQKSLYSVDDVNNLLESLKVNENQIRNLICYEQDNLQCLKLALQIYQIRNKNKNIGKIDFSSIQILNKHNMHNISTICDILKLCSELQFETKFSDTLEYIKNFDFKKEDQLLMHLQLISTLLECNGTNMFNDYCIIFLRDIVATQNIKATTNYFITNILKPYIHLNPNGKETVLKEIITSYDLYMISCLIQEMPLSIFNESFFLHLQSVCYKKHNQWEHKLAVNVLKSFIKSIKNNQFNITLDIIKGDTMNCTEFHHQWESFFTLIEVSEEKQLHLVEPSLGLLKNIDKLKFIWIQCVFEKLLNHMQLSVVYKTANLILDFKLNPMNDYRDCIKSLLLGINKNDFSEHAQNFYKKFDCFLLEMELTRYRIILEESAEINWTPLAAWLFYNHSTKRFSFILNLSDFENIKLILCNLKKLPHRYIRNACFDLFHKQLTLCTANTPSDIVDIFKSYSDKYFDETQSNTLSTSKTIEYNVDDIKNVLLNPENYNEATIASVYAYYNEIFYEVEYTNTILDFWKKRIEEGNVSSTICAQFVKHVCNHQRKLTYLDIEDILDKIVSTQSNDIYITLYDSLGVLMLNLCPLELLFKLIHRWFCELENIKCFKTRMYCTQLYFENFFEKYLYIVDDVEMPSIIVNNIYQNEIKMFSYLKKLPSMYYDDHFDHLLKGLYFGDGLTKHKKYEDEVCYEIFLENGMLNGDALPSLETYIRLDALTACLIGIRMMREHLWKLLDFPKKRYFPNSPDHIRYLRSTQAILLLIQDHSFHTRQLFDVILNNLIYENHQPSVRQLMQWILIKLCVTTEFSFILIEKFKDKAELSESALTSLIVILYHVGLIKTDIIDNVIDMVLEYTMGPVFKLRVYSQITVYNLIIRQNLQTQYNHLYKVLKKTLENNRKAVKNVLNTDWDIFEVFDPVKNYHIKTILVDIPKLNNVISSEWCYIEHCIKNNYENINSLLLMDANKSEFISLTKVPSSNNCSNIENLGTDAMNIQKKIVPNQDVLNNSNINTDLSVIASLITSSANLGGLARTCEIYGVKKLIVHNSKVINDKEFKSLSMSSERWLNIEEVKKEKLIKYINEEKDNGYTVIGAEQTCDSIKLNNYKFPNKSIIILGNEKEGIPFNLLPYLDVCLEIPQFGVLRSLNVHVAGSTFIWEYIKQISLQ